MKLSNVWDSQTIMGYMKETTNEFLQIAGHELLSDSIYNAIVVILEAKLSTVFNCETIYDSQQEGLDKICTYIKRHQLELMVEMTSLLKSLKRQDRLAHSHQQMSFNPLNNEDIDTAPKSTDTTVFNYAEALLMNTQFIINNSAVLDNLYKIILGDVYLIGVEND